MKYHLEEISCGKDKEKSELLGITDGSVTVETSLGFLNKPHTELPYDPLDEKELQADRYFDTNVHYGVIHNSQMILTTQVPTDR